MKLQNQQRPSSTRRIIAARENGRYGGQARALEHDAEVLKEWSSWGGKKVLAKYGREYFVRLRQRRKHYPKYSEPPAQPNWRVVAARENGHRGGVRRVEFYGPDHLREWARLGGIATRNRYGSEFFREIRKKRKFYKKGYITQKTKARLRKEAQQHLKTEKNSAIAELWKAVAREWEK